MKPAFEKLDDRITPSSVKVSFSRGLLAVEGTAAADKITFKQVDGRISLAGFSKTYAASSVKLIVVAAGSGNDQIVFLNPQLQAGTQSINKPTILNGGPGNDHISGGAKNDVIIGGSGNDRMWGTNGNDTIWCGTGHDRAYGGSGTDRLYGNSGQDYLSGGSGNDRIDGGENADRLFGGSGSDLLLGNSGNDEISGSSGSDYLFGGSGDDYLNGGTGRDQLDGGSQSDELFGGDDLSRDTLADDLLGTNWRRRAEDLINLKRIQNNLFLPVRFVTPTNNSTPSTYLGNLLGPELYNSFYDQNGVVRPNFPGRSLQSILGPDLYQSIVVERRIPSMFGWF